MHHSGFRGKLAAQQVLPAVTLLVLVAGLLATYVLGTPETGRQLYLFGFIVTAVPVALRTMKGVLHRRLAADLVALMAIITAFALGEYVVGLVIVLMQTGGEAIEAYAEGRASKAVRDLEEQAPRIAHLFDGSALKDVRVDEIVIGNELLLRPGELVPCDSLVVEGRSHVNASRITGEPTSFAAVAGKKLLSGSINGEGALRLRALAIASESQYARIVELVRNAQATKAPLQRTADRYAVWFTPFTLVTCAATWLVSRDLSRVLAVLAVATPCPLIIATPVALLGGINRCARRQVIVRHGAALEQLGQVTAAVFDKTGTLTVGMPLVSRVAASYAWTPDQVVMYAAAVEEKSSHLLARVLVDYASHSQHDRLESRDVIETPGRGIEGTVAGSSVLVGSRSFAEEKFPEIARSIPAVLEHFSPIDRRLIAIVAVDGELAGVVAFADVQRPHLRELFRRLSALGIRRITLLSGDDAANTKELARALGISDVHGELLPEDKVTRVRALLAEGEKVMMVGDGTNDAPALSSATVGVALAAHGAGITAEAADVILLSDNVARVADAVAISQRTMRVARQSICVGLGASAFGMLLASAGLLAPLGGALVQEAIDLAVILNALRASVPRKGEKAAADPTLGPSPAELQEAVI